MRTRAIARVAVGLAAIVAVMTSGDSPAFAARPVGRGGSGPVGIDVSYPQCGDSLPTGDAFAIVGVNGGLANDYSPCVASQFAYAERLTATTSQPVAQLYVNTADPGNAVADWPFASASGLGSYGTAATPYGDCQQSATETPACAYVYGYDMVAGIGSVSGDVAAFERATAKTPGAYHWWLDVETTNSWLSDTTMNVADLQGMAKGLADAGVTSVGVYSTAYQWNQITGTPGPSISYGGGSVTDTLWGMPDWIPGARRQSDAVANCALTAFTNTNHPVMTQWFGRPYDGDHACS